MAEGLGARIEAIDRLLAQVAAGGGVSYGRPPGSVSGGALENLARARLEIGKLAQIADRSSSEELRLQSLKLRERGLMETVAKQLGRSEIAERFQRAGEMGQQFASLTGIGAKGFFQLQALTELGAVIGRVNPGLLGAVGALGLLTAAAIGAAQRLNQMGAQMAQTGGTAGQVGALGGIFGALGLDQGGIAGTARALRQQVAGGGLGAAAGAALGIPVRPIGVGTPPNEARMLLDAIRNLRGMDEGQARLQAERLPALQPFLALRFASSEQIARMEQMAAAMDRLATPENLGRALEFNLQLQQLRMTFDQLVVIVGGQFLPVLNVILAQIAFLGQQFAGVIPGAGGGTANARSPVDDNTAALQQNTREIAAMNAGLYGGGQRARRAIPGGIGDAADSRFRREAAALGAF